MANKKKSTTSKKTATKSPAKKAAPAKVKKAAAPASKGSAKKAVPAPSGAPKRLTQDDRDKAAKTLFTMASRKAGVKMTEFKTKAGITTGQARGVVEKAIENGQLSREGTPKDSVYRTTGKLPGAALPWAAGCLRCTRTGARSNRSLALWGCPGEPLGRAQNPPTRTTAACPACLVSPGRRQAARPLGAAPPQRHRQASRPHRPRHHEPGARARPLRRRPRTAHCSMGRQPERLRPGAPSRWRRCARLEAPEAPPHRPAPEETRRVLGAR